MKEIKKSPGASSRLQLLSKRGKLSGHRLLCFAFVLLCGNFPHAKADDKVGILSVSSRTSDSVTFQISSSKRAHARGEDVIIDYRVSNNGSRVIYLVSEPKPRLSAQQDKHVLRLESPVKYQDEFTQYDNDLLKVLPGRSFAGKLIIKGNEIPTDKESESEHWDLQVGFSYLFDPSKEDVSDLLGCKNTRYSFPCLGKLFKLSRSLTVGNLVVEIKSH